MIQDQWDLADLTNKAEKEDRDRVIKISGCGLSAIGTRGSSTLVWLANEIIAKGGVPKVTKL